jgi:hypothetical protein
VRRDYFRDHSRTHQKTPSAGKWIYQIWSLSITAGDETRWLCRTHQISGAFPHNEYRRVRFADIITSELLEYLIAAVCDRLP